jgi:hypothetical protein
MTVKEVADRLGISVQAVRAHCRKADGGLNAKLVKTGKKGIRTWVISGGSLLVDPAETQKSDVAAEEVTETAPGENTPPGCNPENLGDTPAGEDDEDKWKKIFEARKGFSDDPEPGERPERSAPFLTSEKLLKLIKGKMPSAMFERNEFLIEVWCEIAPPYLNIDPDKLGKWAVYGIPSVIVVSEADLAKQEKLKKQQAAQHES